MHEDEDAEDDTGEAVVVVDTTCPGTVAVIRAELARDGGLLEGDLTEDAGELLSRTIKAISSQVAHIERAVYSSGRHETRMLRSLVGVGKLLKDCVKAQTELEIIRAGGMSDQELLSAARKIVGAKGKSDE